MKFNKTSVLFVFSLMLLGFIIGYRFGRMDGKADRTPEEWVVHYTRCT